MPTIIDTHAHLYELPDAASVLRDCALAGVSDVVALGVDLASNRRHLELKHNRHSTLDTRHSGVQPDVESGSRVSSVQCPVSRVHLAFGLHPGNITSAADADACLALMLENIKEAIAIGETGLDFWYKWVRKDEDKKREQREVFDRHLALAKEFDLPVVVHSRGAWRECLEQAVRSGVKRVEFHWYSGPTDILRDILDAGFLVSFTPALAYSPEHRKAAEFAPLDRILIETDTPVAYPPEIQDTGHKTQERSSDHRSGVMCHVSGVPKIPSTPKDVWQTLKLLSGIKGVPEEALLQQVNDNAKQFFNI